MYSFYLWVYFILHLHGYYLCFVHIPMATVKTGVSPCR